MLERLETLEDEFVSLESSLSDPEIVSDQSALRRVSRRYKDLTPVVECLRRLRDRTADAAAARELLAEAAEDERAIWREELHETEVDIGVLEEELKLERSRTLARGSVDRELTASLHRDVLNAALTTSNRLCYHAT